MKHFSVANAFAFYCDAKHSDILCRSSHVHCYLSRERFLKFLRIFIKAVFLLITINSVTIGLCFLQGLDFKGYFCTIYKQLP